MKAFHRHRSSLQRQVFTVGPKQATVGVWSAIGRPGVGPRSACSNRRNSFAHQPQRAIQCSWAIFVMPGHVKRSRRGAGRIVTGEDGTLDAAGTGCRMILAVASGRACRTGLASGESLLLFENTHLGKIGPMQACVWASTNASAMSHQEIRSTISGSPSITPTSSAVQSGGSASGH